MWYESFSISQHYWQKNRPSAFCADGRMFVINSIYFRYSLKNSANVSHGIMFLGCP